MIVLDTNVVSEIMSPKGNPEVTRWVNRQIRAELFTTAISEAETFYGIALLPDGRRKAAMKIAADQIFSRDFADHVLAFDGAAARHFAELGAGRRQMGKPISGFDAQIAAVARSHGAILATRNTKDFVDCGLRLINPWEDAP